MEFKQQRDTLIGLMLTALYYASDKETIKFIDNTVSKLCELWGIGEGLLSDEEEKVLFILSSLPREMLEYL